jgi:hypothetical protein
MEATSAATSAEKVPAAPERENDATLVTTVEPALRAVTATASVSVPAAAAIKRWKPAVKVASKAVSTNGKSSSVNVMVLSTNSTCRAGGPRQLGQVLVSSRWRDQ